MRFIFLDIQFLQQHLLKRLWKCLCGAISEFFPVSLLCISILHIPHSLNYGSCIINHESKWSDSSNFILIFQNCFSYYIFFYFQINFRVISLLSLEKILLIFIIVLNLYITLERIDISTFWVFQFILLQWYSRGGVYLASPGQEREFRLH